MIDWDFDWDFFIRDVKATSDAFLIIGQSCMEYSRVLLQRQILKRQLLRQMFVRKLLIFSVCNRIGK